ncbi:MAG: hypothetical protein KKC84_04990, partial [Candidatus Omnitrophica bacterium]|nr:hypothetical protein [Candidatus Omnitrophota bacterium]
MQKFIRLCLTTFLILAPQVNCLANSLIPEDFRDKISRLKWIAYAPLRFNPNIDLYPPEESIREDLELLFRYGFRGIVTYGANKILAQIPRIARETGFQAVIMGIWDLASNNELENALAAVEYVDGYCVGNEGLNLRYDIATLKEVIAYVKEKTGKPVTTTEQVTDYYNDAILEIGDWVFPTIHPFLNHVTNPQKAANWIEKHYKILIRHAGSNKVVFFKEVGFPTAGMKHAN